MGHAISTTMDTSPPTFQPNARVPMKYAYQRNYRNYHTRHIPTPMSVESHQLPYSTGGPKTVVMHMLSYPFQLFERFLDSMGISTQYIHELMDLTGSLFIAKLLRGHSIRVWDLLKLSLWFLLYQQVGIDRQFIVITVYIILQVIGYLWDSTGRMDVQHKL